MNHHIHYDIHESTRAIASGLPIADLENKVMHLIVCVHSLQNHCRHIEEVLRANGIVLPDNLTSQEQNSTTQNPPLKE